MIDFVQALVYLATLLHLWLLYPPRLKSDYGSNCANAVPRHQMIQKTLSQTNRHPSTTVHRYGQVQFATGPFPPRNTTRIAVYLLKVSLTSTDTTGISSRRHDSKISVLDPV